MHIVGFDTFCFFLLSFVLCQSTDVRNHRNWKYLPSKNCGHGAVQDRIVGGSEAALGQFPWMAQLGYELKKSTISYLCAGSLINRWYVLTAKHCFDEQMANTARVVRLGENFLNKNIDCEYDVCAPPVQDIKMSKIISYKTTKNIPLNYADIALVKLAKPARYNDFVSPVCLPRGNIITHVQKHLALNSIVELAGWGVLDSEDEKIPERLMRIYLPVAKLDRCKNFFSMNKIDHSQICIGVGNGKDTCVGDSGGPVMKAIADNSPPKQYIFGIVSYGTKWCGLNSALYTNVTHYLDWILDHIEPIS